VRLPSRTNSSADPRVGVPVPSQPAGMSSRITPPLVSVLRNTHLWRVPAQPPSVTGTHGSGSVGSCSFHPTGDVFQSSFIGVMWTWGNSVPV
jgi:hypothetical protein